MSRILLVEDDLHMSRAVTLSLQARGYEVTTAETGREALRAYGRQPWDLVILDLGLPDMPGIEVLRRIRELDRVPVVVLSARVDRAEKVRLLDSGADDYVTKPFDLEELLARMRAAIRRGTPEHGAPTLTLPEFTIDLARKRVIGVDGAEIHLTPTEWAFLEILARRPGVVVPGAEILREIWGPQYEAETNYLRVYMAQLRKKLEPHPSDPQYLLTTPGVGYRLEISPG